jgi:hypothetical protein
MRGCPCFVLIEVGATRCLSNEGPNSRNSRRHHIQENSRLVILLLSRSHVEGWTDWIRHSQNNMTKHLEATVSDRGMTRCAHCQINHASKLTARDASRLHVYNIHEQGCRCIVPATSDTSKLRMHASAMQAKHIPNVSNLQSRPATHVNYSTGGIHPSCFRT